MTDENIPLPNPQEAETFLADLFEQVKKWESCLDESTKLGVGATAVKSLLESKVSFGNPRDKLILLTEDLFEETEEGLSNIYRQQMRDAFDFYYMTVTVDLRPKPGVRFWRLCCELDFSPKGEKEPIVQSIFPKSQWRPVMNFGVGMNLAINSNLDWSIGIDSTELAEFTTIPAELKANVGNKNELKAFIVIPEYAYEAGHFEIISQGEGNSKCYWRIEEPEIQNIPTVQFAIVFKVPKEIKSINLRGIAWGEPDMNWLTADIRDVFSDLADRFQTLIRNKNQAAIKFSRSDIKEWILNLPKANLQQDLAT
ncbi:hypothetical protein [Moorena bouillonii]|uniref:Uncharacterized protein n=1 Tax=Moorena bouillonii PNG TaxID=568701 RepID=A0A1U7N3J0_9CYAN|nr:hypothetical protein [Moorena bouillonii]OLT60517.1 hypothetical protein BJP37_17375 [Moorena bouillonii PNG]